MTLKEKFEECLWAFDKNTIKNQSEKCDAIADEFTIKFTRWLNEIQSFHSGEDAYYYGNRWYTYEEILKVYKKENKL
jgi:hypothetical protein